MKNNFPRSLQNVIILLVAVGLVAIALGGYFNPVSSWFTRLMVDGQTWISTRVLAVEDFLTVPRDVASLRQRNTELEAEVAQLQTQVIDLQQKVTETNILSALVDFARANPNYSYKAAAVIGRDPSPFLRYVIINIGSNQGILPGMPVVTEKGLVGRVDAVIAEASRVQLVTDAASAVNVRLQSSNTEAMLVGSVTGDVSLDMISQDAHRNRRRRGADLRAGRHLSPQSAGGAGGERPQTCHRIVPTGCHPTQCGFQPTGIPAGHYQLRTSGYHPPDHHSRTII